LISVLVIEVVKPDDEVADHVYRFLVGGKSIEDGAEFVAKPAVRRLNQGDTARRRWQ